MEYSIPFVCVFGILTVFCSLVVIVLLSTVMSAIIRAVEKSRKPAPAAPAKAAPAPAPTPVPAQPAAPEITPELIAAVTAAIADDLGVDFSNVRITAIQKA